MNSDLVGLGILTLAGIFCGAASLSQLRRARIIEDTPTSKIRSAHQGYIELIGSAMLPVNQAPLLSSLAGQPCLWFRYRIERYERNGKNSSWRTIESHSSTRPFMLNDGTGVCLIYPERAEVNSHHRRQWHGSSRRPSAGISATSLLLGRRYRYTEERLCENDLIYALGIFDTRHPPRDTESNSARMAEILSEWKQDYDRLVERFDRNGDGQISPEEWELARREALRKAEREQRGKPALEAVNTLRYSPSRQQPFIIATSEPESLSRRYRWQSLAWLLGSLACIAGVAWLVHSGAVSMTAR